jgi:hypothetical protein
MSSAAVDTVLGMILDNSGAPLVATDRSTLLIYPAERELDALELLDDRIFATLTAKGRSFERVDLRWKLFECFEPDEIADLSEDEFFDRKLVRQDIASRIEYQLHEDLQNLSSEKPQTPIFLVRTAFMHPFVRFGELLKNLRNAECPFFVMFPGEERGGKLHFMNEPDGGNYLATKINLF